MNITNVQSQSHSPVRDAATVLPVRPDAGSGFLVYARERPSCASGSWPP